MHKKRREHIIKGITCIFLLVCTVGTVTFFSHIPVKEVIAQTAQKKSMHEENSKKSLLVVREKKQVPTTAPTTVPTEETSVATTEPTTKQATTEQATTEEATTEEATTEVETEPEESEVEPDEREMPDWTGEVLSPGAGRINGPSGEETYYNLDMSGCVAIMRDMGYDYEYHVREDGVKMFGAYVMCAANLDIRPKGTLIPCSLGMAIVVDTGGFAEANPNQLDIAVDW